MSIPTAPRRYNRRHEELLTWVALYPNKTLKEIAKDLGYSESWVATLIRSDIFQDRLRELQSTFKGTLFASTNAKMTAAVHMALDRLMETMEEEKLGAGQLLEIITRMMPRPDAGAVGPQAPMHLTQNNVNLIASSEGLAQARQVLMQAKRMTAPVQAEPETPDDLPAVLER